jgi:hypothetical protein
MESYGQSVMQSVGGKQLAAPLTGEVQTLQKWPAYALTCNTLHASANPCSLLVHGVPLYRARAPSGSRPFYWSPCLSTSRELVAFSHLRSRGRSASVDERKNLAQVLLWLLIGDFGRV